MNNYKLKNTNKMKEIIEAILNDNGFYPPKNASLLDIIEVLQQYRLLMDELERAHIYIPAKKKLPKSKKNFIIQ